MPSAKEWDRRSYITCKKRISSGTNGHPFIKMDNDFPKILPWVPVSKGHRSLWVTLTQAIVKLPISLRGRIAEICLEPVSQQLAKNRAAADRGSTLSHGLREVGGDQARFAEAEK
jgi:hypothetical protein